MRLVVAITGASGAVYGVRLLQALAAREVEVHLIISRAAREIIPREAPATVEDIMALAARAYEEDDLGAPPASGSFRHQGMIIAPCSMKTLAGIAAGYAANLIQRAADVALKEQRRLVLLPRETPLSAIHLENMLKLARLGVVIMPPLPAFYLRPATLDEAVQYTVGRVLDFFDLAPPDLPRWGEEDYRI
ncbi:MAG: UbiX family flavin prenyltransferase [Bacillota bacterium]|nr:UbiX family flavin prenyltransferase [Bacillota bacterium]